MDAAEDIAADAASDATTEPTLGELFKPAGKHDEVRPLLARLGLKKYTKTFAKAGIESIALLRSLREVGSLRANLKELKLEDEDIKTLTAAILTADTFETTAATGGHTTVPDEDGTTAARRALLAGELSDASELSEDEPPPPPQPVDPHRVHVSKEEYDHIMDWSDDEDDETPRGRFNRRKKKQRGYQTTHDTQFMLREGDEGMITDVSKGPRNILKKLVCAATGFQNPVEGYEVDFTYVGRLCETVNGPYGPTCGPVGPIFDERYAETPYHAVVGSGAILEPLERAIETMREGEKAEVTINPRVAYGATGNTKLGIPPYAFLVYEVHVVKVYEVTYLHRGSVVKKVLQLPEMTGTPGEDSEVTVRWTGKVYASGTVFRRMCTQTFRLNEPDLPPWWKAILFDEANGNNGRQGMGEGEIAQFTVPPELGFGSAGNEKLGVPPDATLILKVTLERYVSYEDMSPEKAPGTVIRRIEKRGQPDEPPHKGDECTIGFKVSNARTGEVYQEVKERTMTLGEMPDRQREVLRLMTEGAYADRVIELLVSKMRTEEESSVRCPPAFIGGNSGDDIIVFVVLHKVIKLFTCPETNNAVQVRISRDPTEGRGPNEEATCRVRYRVRVNSWDGPLAISEVVEEEGFKKGSKLYTFVQNTGQVLPCIDYAVRQMKPGGVAVVSSPAQWAYGARGWDPPEEKRAIKKKNRRSQVEVDLELVDVVRFKANYAMELEGKMKTQLKRKEQGNALFKKGEYEDALWRYDESIEYAAMASEVCQRDDMPYVEQHKHRKTIDENKVSTYVNMAVCHLKLVGSGKPVKKPHTGEEDVAYKETGAPPPRHESKAIEYCDKALAVDKLSMKALYRRGQAYKAMGDLVKAKDDLIAAARRDPNSREIRQEIEEVKELERQEDEAAKTLWKKNFITEQMSFRAQQGAASVAEALGEKKKEEPLFKKGFLSGGKRLGNDDDDEPRVVELDGEEAERAKAAAAAAAAATAESEEESSSSDDDVIVEDDEDDPKVQAAKKAAEKRAAWEAAKAKRLAEQSSSDDYDSQSEGEDIMIEEMPLRPEEIPRSEGAPDGFKKGFLSGKKKPFSSGRKGPAPSLVVDRDTESQAKREIEEGWLMPWDPEPPLTEEEKAAIEAKKKAQKESEERAANASTEEEILKAGKEAVARGKKKDDGDDGDDEDEDDAASTAGGTPSAVEGAPVRKRRTFKFDVHPTIVLPNGIDVHSDGGLMKRILRPGNALAGKPPKDAVCKVHFVGWLMDGTKFDNTRERFGNPFFKLGSKMFCRSLEEGVATMNRGELAEFVSHAGYAFEARGWKDRQGVPRVQPHATVRWEIELFSWSGFEGDFSKMTDGEILDSAFGLKGKGNDFVKNEMWDEAAERYHEAINMIDHPKFNQDRKLPDGWVEESNKLLITCRLNEAMCEIKREGWIAAIALCDKVLEKPQLLTRTQKAKAYYRRHQAHFARQEYDEALRDLQAAQEFDDRDIDMRNAMMMCRMAKRNADRLQKEQWQGKLQPKKPKEPEPASIPRWTGALPTCWLEVGVNNTSLGRIVIELDVRAAPKSCENFRCLCTGERGFGAFSSRALHYKGVKFHRVIRGFMVQGGDVVSGDGMGGESIFGGQFEDENLDGKHDRPGVVSMANAGRDMNGSQFFITTVAAPHLDGSHVVIGHVVSGMDVVRRIERSPVNDQDVPLMPVTIDNCGSDAKSIPHEPVPLSQHANAGASRKAPAVSSFAPDDDDVYPDGYAVGASLMEPPEADIEQLEEVNTEEDKPSTKSKGAAARAMLEAQMAAEGLAAPAAPETPAALAAAEAPAAAAAAAAPEAPAALAAPEAAVPLAALAAAAEEEADLLAEAQFEPPAKLMSRGAAARAMLEAQMAEEAEKARQAQMAKGAPPDTRSRSVVQAVVDASDDSDDSDGVILEEDDGNYR